MGRGYSPGTRPSASERRMRRVGSFALRGAQTLPSCEVRWWRGKQAPQSEYC